MVSRAGAVRVAVTSLVLAVIVAAAKLVVGAMTGSLAIISEGLHSTLDAGATALTLVAVRVADRPPDQQHPYGHGRIENLVALGEAIFLIILGGVVARDAIQRLVNDAGHISPPWYAIALMVVSLGVDWGRSRALRDAARRYDSPALEADAANFTADLVGSLAVLSGLLLARAGWQHADPVASLAVVGLVWFIGGKIGFEASQVLMDRSPEDLEEKVYAAAGRVEGVEDVSAVRARKSGPATLADVTVSVGRTRTVERSHEIAEQVEKAVAQAVPGASAVVHVEPSEAGEDFVARVFAAALRVGLADQVHNITAIEHPEGLWLTLHAKVPADAPLANAHDVADLLEQEIRREIDSLARVEIHLEPHSRRALVGRDETALHPQLITEVKSIAEREPPIASCSEAAISATGNDLHLVLHCAADPATEIEEIHSASQRIEAEIHRRHPEVASVTVHFEPL